MKERRCVRNYIKIPISCNEQGKKTIFSMESKGGMLFGKYSLTDTDRE